MNQENSAGFTWAFINRKQSISEGGARKGLRRDRRRHQRIVVCTPCHQRKLKCNKGQPCSRCAQSGTPGKCIYQQTPGKRQEPGAKPKWTPCPEAQITRQPSPNSSRSGGGARLDGATSWTSIACEFEETPPYVAGTDLQWAPRQQQILGLDGLFPSLPGNLSPQPPQHMRQESATPPTVGSNATSASLSCSVQTEILSDMHTQQFNLNWRMLPMEAATFPGTNIQQSYLDQTMSLNPIEAAIQPYAQSYPDQTMLNPIEAAIQPYAQSYPDQMSPNPMEAAIIQQPYPDQTISLMPKSHGSLPQDYSQDMQLQCWENGCNGLQFANKTTLEEHQRAMACPLPAICPNCMKTWKPKRRASMACVPFRPDGIASPGANRDSPGVVHEAVLFAPIDVVQIPEQTALPPNMCVQQSSLNQTMAAVQTPMKSPGSFFAESPNVSDSEYGRDSIANIRPLISPGVDPSMSGTVPNTTWA
ncbi:hypothetical protein QBC46DRAFT_419110 [Diplogelasinospora grovesii]|uniref:Zn(2)-C6 fungal-type domain-containing protein n=1 Tax=Diplogelasinospora grovesii TaxID=303347 RepID=A0AAN6S117_9PEZI|nr:hypothetical protein QBC46DRAFT_419110 [Diplogelasinospora grovesii]